jgi:hypothetical protein
MMIQVGLLWLLLIIAFVVVVIITLVEVSIDGDSTAPVIGCIVLSLIAVGIYRKSRDY